MSELTKKTYKEIAYRYGESKMLPFRIHLEKYSFLKLLGDIRGMDVLDLACGTGVYTRILKKNGTLQTIGVDISEEMVEIARKMEADEPLGVVYLVKDIAKLKSMGTFDFVVAVYLLNYAQSEEQLKVFVQSIYKHLKPGAKFVAINDNLRQDPNTYTLTKEYGFVKAMTEERKEGSPIHYTFFKNGKEDFNFNNYYLYPETYERVFLDAGFKSFSWEPVELSEEGKKDFPEGYWNNFLKAAPIIGIVAVK